MGLEERWTDIDKMLQPAPMSSKELHERVVPDVAKARFEFPTAEHPSYRTFVNVPEVTLPITDDAGNQHAPDIVVVDTPGNVLKIVAQVETADMVTPERAREVWSVYAKLRNVAFYLYVPVGYGGAAKRLAKEAGLDIYGFRTWRYVPQGIEINDISEPPEIIHALMPPFARKLMRGQ